MILFSVASLKAQSYFTYVDSADSYIQKKEWVKAETSILEALKLEPANYNNSLLLSNLATIQRMQGRTQEAINNYTLALNITPNAVTLLNNRGILYYEVDSVALALKDFDRVMELDKKDIDSRYYTASIMIDQNDLATSKKIIDELSKINSKTDEVKILNARWNQVSGNFNEAILLYSGLLKNDIQLDWLTHRAECYIETKSLGNAAADINDALKIDPTFGYLYLLKAVVYKMQYQNEDSLKNLELAVRYGVDRKFAEKALETKKII